MTLAEALRVLEFKSAQEVTDVTLKKRWRQLMKLQHGDVTKDLHGGVDVNTAHDIVLKALKDGSLYNMVRSESRVVGRPGGYSNVRSASLSVYYIDISTGQAAKYSHDNWELTYIMEYNILGSSDVYTHRGRFNRKNDDKYSVTISLPYRIGSVLRVKLINREELIQLNANTCFKTINFNNYLSVQLTIVNDL